MPYIKVSRSVEEATVLFEKASAVIDRFGSKSAEIAPLSLCRLYFLLEFLRHREVHVVAELDQIQNLKTLFQRCQTLLEQRDPAEGSLSYTWPAATESDLRSQVDAIDRELVHLQYYVPTETKLSTWLANSPELSEPPSLRALNEDATARRRERRDSILDAYLPVTIKLRKSLEVKSPPLYNLQHVNIADKDDVSRVLHFKNFDLVVAISHKIKKGTIPYIENKLHATHANFRDPQTLVIRDSHLNYEVSSAYPQYVFANADHLDLFIRTVRERRLLGKFLPDKIYQQGQQRDPLARRKVVRLWIRHERRPVPEVTLTFENTRANEQRDWHLDQFRYPAILSQKGNSVEIMTLDLTGCETTFLFADKDRASAKDLCEVINNYHPNKPYRPGVHLDRNLITVDFERHERPLHLSRGSTSESTTAASRTRSSSGLGISTPASGSTSTRSGVIIPGLNLTYEPESDAGLSRSRSPPAVSPKCTDMPIQRTLNGQPQQPRNRRDFQVAIICALTREADAVEATFDEEWLTNYEKARGDDNAYSFGRIGSFNVVVIHLPLPGMGTVGAATAATNCHRSFSSVRLCLVVGVCGGMFQDTERREMALGDVVISEGIVKYDFGKQYPEGFKRIDSQIANLPRPDNKIRGLLAMMSGRRGRQKLQETALIHLKKMEQELGSSARYPSPGEDRLFDSSYRHRHRNEAECDVCGHNKERICDRALETRCPDLVCDDSKVVRKMDQKAPAVFFGNYASADQVMKSGEVRDHIAKSQKVIAFEMEGAGAWDCFPGRCLIIKGICDYADSHKNKDFQDYAAATAAAFTKAFLASWSGSGDESD